MKKIIALGMAVLLATTGTLSGCGNTNNQSAQTSQTAILDRPAEEWDEAAVCAAIDLGGSPLKPEMTLRDLGPEIEVDADSVVYYKRCCEGELKHSGKSIGTFSIDRAVGEGEYMDAPLSKLLFNNLHPKRKDFPISVNGTYFGDDIETVKAQLYFMEPLFSDSDSPDGNTYCYDKGDLISVYVDAYKGKVKAVNVFFSAPKNK